MQYMFMLYAEPAPADAPPPSPEEMQAWMDYNDVLKEAGCWVAGDGLLGPETATSLQVRDGETILTDGPYAETKEVLGGYYVIDVDDLDTATSWAAKCPAAFYGTVEIRPVMDLSAYAPQ